MSWSRKDFSSIFILLFVNVETLVSSVICIYFSFPVLTIDCVLAIDVFMFPGRDN